jgi:hypothetical protein
MKKEMADDSRHFAENENRSIKQQEPHWRKYAKTFLED